MPFQAFSPWIRKYLTLLCQARWGQFSCICSCCPQCVECPAPNLSFWKILRFSKSQYSSYNFDLISENEPVLFLCLQSALLQKVLIHPSVYVRPSALRRRSMSHSSFHPQHLQSAWYLHYFILALASPVQPLVRYGKEQNKPPKAVSDTTGLSFHKLE